MHVRKKMGVVKNGRGHPNQNWHPVYIDLESFKVPDPVEKTKLTWNANDFIYTNNSHQTITSVLELDGVNFSTMEILSSRVSIARTHQNNTNNTNGQPFWMYVNIPWD